MTTLFLVALPGALALLLAVFWIVRRSWWYAEVPSGGLIPHFWLGRAWVRFDRDHSVFLPIPVNVAARHAVNGYYRLRAPLDPMWFEDRMAQMYWNGYRQGRADRARDAA